jgi:hypothetical protein
MTLHSKPPVNERYGDLTPIERLPTQWRLR